MDSLKEQIKGNLDKAKTETTNRAGRIGEILKTAVTQSLAELKDGSGEIRAIATDSIATVTNTVNPTSAETETPSNSLVSLIKAIRNRFVTEFSTRWQTLDMKFATQYGDRYETVKQHWSRVSAWYNNARANSETPISDQLQQKQAVLEDKVGNAGATIAQQEQQLKARVKTFVQSVTNS